MKIRVMPSVAALDQEAADHAARVLERQLDGNRNVRLVVATGSTQLGFLERLTSASGIDWPRVELFHLDEYVGLSPDHPGSFCRFIRERIIDRTGITRFHLLDGTRDPVEVMREVGAELRRAPVDLAFTGIGENGHLAFNEPPADFHARDPFLLVSLDEVSRRQQVGEAWFARLEDVPTRAMTMSVPQILQAREILCLVHGTRKARAVHACFQGPPTPMAPASILATHEGATVYLDPEAASLLSGDVPA